MKKIIRGVFVLLIVFVIPSKAAAFLADADSQNLFQLIEQSPWIAVVQVDHTENPSGSRRYFIHHLKIKKLLYGEKIEGKTLKAFQEIVFPSDKSAIQGSEEKLIFLAPMPNYSAYAQARSEGTRYRLMSGTSAVLSWNSDDAQIVQEALALREKGANELQKKSMLLKVLQSSKNIRLQDEALEALALLTLPKNSLVQDEVKIIVDALNSPQISSRSKLAGVAVMRQEGGSASITALQDFADGEPGLLKWASIRALESMGLVRPIKSLIKDFYRAGDFEKSKALSLIVKQPGQETNDFLTQLLTGSESSQVKINAIDSMARIKGAYEKILVSQLDQLDENVAVHAILALGRNQSKEAVPKLIILLDSPSKILRSAAILALEKSEDPVARQILHERFPGEGLEDRTD